jgi:beta-lactamase regulating signal transducer with metallopeptidase domain/uncharacterized GH25 family protein
MMNAFLISLNGTPMLVILLKLSFLLALLWLVYFWMSTVSPAWRARFWRIGLGLMVIVVILSSAPPQLYFEIEHATAPESQLAEGVSSAILIDEPVSGVVAQQMDSPLTMIPTPALDSLAASASPTVAFSKPKISSFVAAVWFSGFAFLLIRFALSVVYLRRSIRPIEESESHIEVQRLAAALNLRRAPQVAQANVASPCLLVVPSLRILLPENVLSNQFDYQLPEIFAHELAHLKRNDWQWNLAFRGLEMLLWFHPLVWKIRATHLNDCENACDDMAAELTGGRANYQHTLARVAMSHVEGRQIVGLPMIQHADIIKRLRRLEFPLENFSLRKLMMALVMTSALAASAGTFGLNFVSTDSETDEKAAVDPHEFSVKLQVAAEQLKDAVVEVEWYEGTEQRFNTIFHPDKRGWVRGRVGKEAISNISIICRVPGFVPYAISRHNRNQRIELPQKKKVEFEKSHRIYGKVRDAAGNPVAGATINLRMKSQDAWDQSVSFRLAAMTSGENGSWSYDDSPWSLKAWNVYADVHHPEYLHAMSSQPRYPNESIPFEAVMRKGKTLRGRVVDPAGKAVANASVWLGSPSTRGVPNSKTDSDGNFDLKNCPSGKRFVVVSSDAFAPQMVDVEIDSEQPDSELSIALLPGNSLKAQVVDQFGKPVPDILISVQDWRKPLSLPFKVRTDESGRFHWKNAPADAVWFNLSGKNHRLIVHHELTASEDEHQIVMQTNQTVSIKIVDAENGELLSGHVMRGLKWSTDRDDAHWDGKWTPFYDGSIEYRFCRQVAESKLRIWTPGYGSIVKSFKLGQEDAELTVRLKRFDSVSDEKWEPIRIRIENGTLPMQAEAAASSLRKQGAVVGMDDDGRWKITLTNQYTIPSAMLGVANIVEDESKKTWQGTLSDFENFQDLENVELTLDGFMLNQELLKALKIPSVVAVKFDNCPLHLTNAEWPALGTLKQLREISLDGHWQEFPPAAVDALAQLPKLEALVFEGCGAYHMDSSTFAGRLSKMKNLKKLSLSCHGSFDNSIGKEIAQLQNLRSLRVRGDEISDPLIDAIAELPLESLTLAMTRLSDRGLKTIANSFEDLRELDIERTGVTEDGLRDVIGQLPRLESLTVEMLSAEVLLDFKRKHRDCVIRPISYGHGSVMSHPPVELPKDETEE